MSNTTHQSPEIKLWAAFLGVPEADILIQVARVHTPGFVQSGMYVDQATLASLVS